MAAEGTTNIDSTIWSGAIHFSFRRQYSKHLYSGGCINGQTHCHSSWQCFVSKGSTWSCGQQWSVSCVCVCEECRCIITVSMQCSLYWWTLAGEGHWSLLVWSVWRGLLPICYLFYFSQVILLGCWDSACVHSYSKSCSAHLRYRELHWPVWFSAVCRRGMAGHFRLHRVHSHVTEVRVKIGKGEWRGVQRSGNSWLRWW